MKNALAELCFLADDGEPMTTSLLVREKFGKWHKNVLRDVERIIATSEPEVARLNFEPGFYDDAQGQQRPMYRMTEKGFSLLVMGFTGEKAQAWKSRFYDAFAAMRRHLTQASPPPRTPAADAALQMLVDLFPKVIEKVDAIGAQVISLADEIARRGRGRQPVLDSVRRAHILAADGRCACCREPRPLEIDHFFSNQLADFAHTWPICHECHEKLTRNVDTRPEHLGRFAGYQEYARKALHLGRRPATPPSSWLALPAPPMPSEQLKLDLFDAG